MTIWRTDADLRCFDSRLILPTGPTEPYGERIRALQILARWVLPGTAHRKRGSRRGRGLSSHAALAKTTPSIEPTYVDDRIYPAMSRRSRASPRTSSHRSAHRKKLTPACAAITTAARWRKAKSWGATSLAHRLAIGCVSIFRECPVARDWVMTKLLRVVHGCRRIAGLPCRGRRLVNRRNVALLFHIIGAGPSGLYLAYLLKRSNPSHVVRVFEQNRSDVTFGFGVVLSGRALHFVAEGSSEVVERIKSKMQHWSNQHIVYRGQCIIVDGSSYAAIERLTLLRELQALCVEQGVDLKFECRAEHAADLAQCDVMIGADGANSAIREGYADAFDARVTEFAKSFCVVRRRAAF